MSECHNIYIRLISVGRGTFSTIDAYSTALYQVLKDHNCPEAIELATSSQLHAVRRAALQQHILLPANIEVGADSHQKKTVNLVLCSNMDGRVKTDIRAAMQKVKFL